MSSGPVYFYNPPPPPPPKGNKNAAGNGAGKASPSVPTEAPAEIKPEQSKEPEVNISDGSDDKASDSDKSKGEGAPDGAPGDVPGGVPGGITGGIPGGIVFDDPEALDISSWTDEPLKSTEANSSLRRTKYIHPTYPPKAQSAGISGTVIIEVIVGRNGKIKSVRVLKSIPALDSAALDAIKQWEYKPVVVDGIPREVIFTITVNFILR